MPEVAPAPEAAPAPAPAPAPEAAPAPVVAPAPNPPHPDDALTRIKEAYATDPWFANPGHTAGLTETDGFWWRGYQLVVPDVPTLKDRILWELNDAPFSGHQGRDKTREAVKRHYWWPGMDGM